MVDQLDERVRTFDVRPDITVGAQGQVMIVIWRDAPSVERFRDVERHMSHFREGLPGRKFALLAVMASDIARTPTQEARLEHARLCEKYQEDMVVSALVLGGSGLKQTMVRMAMATMQLMSPPGVRQGLFESAEAAVEWLQRSITTIAADELISAVRWLQAATASRRPDLWE